MKNKIIEFLLYVQVVSGTCAFIFLCSCVCHFLNLMWLYWLIAPCSAMLAVLAIINLEMRGIEKNG